MKRSLPNLLRPLFDDDLVVLTLNFFRLICDFNLNWFKYVHPNPT